MKSFSASSSSSSNKPLPGTSGLFSSLHKNLMSASSSLTAAAASKASKPENPIIAAQRNSNLYDTTRSASIIDEKKGLNSRSLGKGWHNVETIEVDESLKRDLQMIQMRNYMDPKRFYKNPDKPGPIVGVGTVIEGRGEYKSARLLNRDRRQSITGEILSDSSIKQYTKRVFGEIQAVKSSKRKTFKASKKEGKHKKQQAYF